MPKFNVKSDKPFISDDMRAAGLAAYERYHESVADYYLVEEIYIAMRKAELIERRRPSHLGADQ